MAEQVALSELRFPPEVEAAVQRAVAAVGVSPTAAPEKVVETAAKKETSPAPRSPFLMFINGKSGGRLGPDLLRISSELLTPAQVFDLSSAKPHKVVPAVLECLEEMSATSEAAKACRDNLKIFVAGGDGTVGWLLSVIESVEKPPPVAVIPLGTGNDLSRSYGWGPTFEVATRDRIEKRLLEGAAGTACNLDSWVLKVTPSADVNIADLTQALPPALHKGTAPNMEGGEDLTEFTGNVYNYFSIGMDAQVAHAFHHLREEKPHLARGPRANKLIYSTFGCTQGWFCATCAPQTHVRCLHMVASMQIQKEAGGPFVDLPLDNSLRAVMILNLQSYAGGRDPWGKPSAELEKKNGWTPARPDDGKLEILGLKDGWHSLMMLGKVTGGLKIAQAYGVRIELRGEFRNAAYLQLDGEPWEQKLSADSREPTVVEITRKPRAAVMLANAGAKVLEKIRAGDAAAAAVPAAVPPAPARAAEAGVPVASAVEATAGTAPPPAAPAAPAPTIEATPNAAEQPAAATDATDADAAANGAPADEAAPATTSAAPEAVEKEVTADADSAPAAEAMAAVESAASAAEPAATS